MASDGEPTPASDDETLPDERAVIAERARDLEQLDEEDFFSADEVAESLGMDFTGKAASLRF